MCSGGGIYVSLLFGWFLTIRSHSDDRCGSEKIINPVWDLSFRLSFLRTEKTVRGLEKFLLSYTALLTHAVPGTTPQISQSSFFSLFSFCAGIYTLLAPVDRWRSRLHSKNYDFLQWQPRWVSFFLCGGEPPFVSTGASARIHIASLPNDGIIKREGEIFN